MDDTACAACGAETLLFECPRCEQAYCADHELPHHACTAPSQNNELAAAGFVPLTEAVGAGQPMSESNVKTVSFGVRDRDAARQTRPDTERRWPVPEVRGLPGDREKNLEQWFRQQSLISYTLKIGVLAMLFSGAYFAGLAAALYGFV